MRISMWSSFLYGRRFETIIPAMHQAGFNSLDLSTEHLEELVTGSAPRERARRWRDMGRDHDLPLLQTHLLLDADLSVRGSARVKLLDLLKRELELVMLMEIPAAVIHTRAAGTGHKEEIAEALLELCSFLEGSSSSLALENLVTGEVCARDLLELIALAGDHPRLGICLDTGHLHVAGGDPAAFLEEAGERLTALHIADNTGSHDDHLLPLGRGTVPWKPFMKKLKSMDYKGIFSFEASGENPAEYPEVLDAKLLYSAHVAKLLLAMA